MKKHIILISIFLILLSAFLFTSCDGNAAEGLFEDELNDSDDRGDSGNDVTSLAAPEGLTATGTNGSTGKIKGLDSSEAYQYATSESGPWTDIGPSVTEITGLAPGTYYVRTKGDGSDSSDSAVLNIPLVSMNILTGGDYTVGQDLEWTVVPAVKVSNTLITVNGLDGDPLKLGFTLQGVVETVEMPTVTYGNTHFQIPVGNMSENASFEVKKGSETLTKDVDYTVNASNEVTLLSPDESATYTYIYRGFKLGDVNRKNDGVKATDSTLASQAATGNRTICDEQTVLANVDKLATGQSVNSDAAYLIGMYAAHMY